MRILIAVHTYWPDNNGVQMVTQYIAEGLAKSNEVMVVTELKDSYCKNEDFNNVHIERINVRNKRGQFVGDKTKFYKLIEGYTPDVLISVCTQSWPFDWLFNKLNLLPGKKILYTHGFSGLLKKYPVMQDLLRGRLNALKYHLHWKKYYRTAYKYMREYDLITHLSENNISFWYAQKHHLKNNAILGNAVEDIFWENNVLKRADKNELVRYVYIANYDSNKNQKMLLKVFYLMDIEDVCLTMVGSLENEYYEELAALKKQLDEKYGKKNVELLTQIPRNKIPDILYHSDIFVCCSKKEEYPIMLCEAAAVGLPIISTDVGHASKMQGCLVVNGEIEMKEAMEYLGKNPDERIKRGMLLRKHAECDYKISEKVSWLEKQIELLNGD